MGSAGSTDNLIERRLPVLAGNDHHLTRFELHTPTHMVRRIQGGTLYRFPCSLRLATNALTLAVDKEFYLIGMIIVAPQVNFLSLLPVPVREQIEHRFVGPFALVHIIDILRLSGQVDDTKIAAAGGETVRRRLTDIVETRPDKLSTDIRCMLHDIPRLFVCRTPGGVHIVVG